MRAMLRFHSYKYFPYEKRLARREIESLSRTKIVKDVDCGYEVETEEVDALLGLVYFSEVVTAEGSRETRQFSLEKTCATSGAKRRQSTRYSVHGLHEYKGKFNPQIVGSLLNVLNLDKRSVVLDPFGGSGTTVTECALHEIKAIGTDINPLAVKIANAKLLAMSTPYQELEDSLDEIMSSYRSSAGTFPGVQTNEDAYLEKWFPREKLDEVNRLRAVIEKVSAPASEIFICLASNYLRNHSYQDPGDLRIRRRKTPVPAYSFADDFFKASRSFLDSLKNSQEIIGVLQTPNKEILGDCRSGATAGLVNNFVQGRVDALITSPPYATALPYIDSQRLSLVWLGLASSSKLLELEATLIGSREIKASENEEWKRSMIENSHSIPEEVADFCRRLENSIGESDGFRKRAVPSLLYRYFCGMQEHFLSCSSIVKKNAPYALVVGQNSTTVGGTNTLIDTPAFLGKLASNCGWRLEHIEELDAYHRYGLHQSNSIKRESLVILRRE